MSLEEKIAEREKQQQKEFDIRFWKPRTGESIEGTVLDHGATITEYGDQEFLDLQDDAGQKWRVWLNAILERLVDEEGVGAGDRVRIKFIGTKPSKKNPEKTYKDFLLASERQ